MVKEWVEDKEFGERVKKDMSGEKGVWGRLEIRDEEKG